MKNKTFSLDNIQHLKTQGIYFLYKDENLVYIGVSKNVYNRVLEHNFENIKDFDSIKSITYMKTSPYIVLEIMEVFLINKFSPKYNKLRVDNIFTYYHTLPSVVIDLIGKNNFNIAKTLLDKLVKDIEKQGFEK